MDDIFARAREAITTEDIQIMFGPGKWDRDEFWCRNPLRADANPGSFSISSKGLYNDFASGDKGDLIDLIAKTRGIEPIAAARLLLRESESEQRPAPERIPPQPHPDEAAYERAINAYTSAKKITAEWGKPILKSHYYNDNGQPIFTVVRYERLRGGVKEKTIRQVYYGVDEKLHMGLPYPHGRPLWNLPRLKARADAPVLVVEGEKCAEQGQRALPGWVVVTWCGGAQAVDKTDWTPLMGRDVTIWPDHDSAGKKAADKIREKLNNQAEILHIDPSKSAGWDLSDCIAEGQNLLDILRGQIQTESNKSEAKQAAATHVEPSYTPLGYDKDFHHFLLNKRRTIMSIPVGKFTRSQIIELAPPAEWGLRGGLSAWVYDEKFGYESMYTTKSGGIKQDNIQVLLNEESTKAGPFKPKNVRGVGIWKDEEGRIIVHDGYSLKTHDGKEIPIDQSGKYQYVSSAADFENVFGEAAAESEGKELENLLTALPFQNKTGAIMATGWALVSNFAGCLPWRPHIWVTGPSGSGKSTMILSKLIKPLVGDLHFSGSGETTKAATRRSLANDCRPAIFDEFEPNNKDKMKNMQDILYLARNASTDSSMEQSIVDDGKVTTLFTRSCFCFSSINLTTEDQATLSRITPIEIKRTSMDDRKSNKDKLLQLDKLLHKNAAKFRRRIFQKLPLILEDMDFLKNELRETVGNDRKIDQILPMLAFFYALTHDDLGHAERDPIEMMAFVNKHVAQLMNEAEETIMDEDYVVESILEFTDHTVCRDSVAQLINYATSPDEQNSLGRQRTADENLQRLGLRVIYGTGGYTDPIFLYIRTDAKKLKDNFINTRFDRYSQQLMRHDLFIKKQKKYVNGHKVAVCIFPFAAFKAKYLGDDDEINDPGDNPYAA